MVLQGSSSAVFTKYSGRGRFALVAALSLSLAACGGDNSSPRSSNGSLQVNQGASIQVSPGVAFPVSVSLQGSTGVTALPVSITSSDTTVATVNPGRCNLSSAAGQDSCQVIVHGLAPGNLSLNVAASGYDMVNAPISLQTPTTPNYGNIQIGAFPSAKAPSTTAFSMTAQEGSIVTLATSIIDYKTKLDGVPIIISVKSESGTATIIGNAQCAVDSGVAANQYCLYKVQMPAASGSVTVKATAVGATAPDFAGQAPTVNIQVQAAAVPGTLVLQSRGADVPKGMSSPFWAVLQDSSGVGDTTVSVTALGGITVNPGVSATTGAYTTDSCTLSSSNPVCGFGVKGITTGSASVSATATGYTVVPLALSVANPDSASRTIAFKNTVSDSVWVGITGGTATSYLTKDMVTTIDPQTNGANVTCGPSNAGSACSTGSTCRQGGANPGSKTEYFCYWDEPTPSNGYEISAAAGKTSKTTVTISDSSYDPIGDITWSGNFYPRQGCTLDKTSGELKCAIADCGNATSGSACAPGTGGSPGIATLEEITLQGNSTDYYDISIIGGANVAAAFGPDFMTAVVTASGYSCGTAGSATAQNGLLGSDWDMATHVQTMFPSVSSSEAFSVTGQTVGAQSTAYYHYIKDPAGGRVNAGCATNTTACVTGYVCGYDKAAVNSGSTSDYVSSCGTHLDWLSANAIAALNTSATNKAPFPFSSPTYNTQAAGTVMQASLYLCNASTKYSGYSSEDASTACGCTNWGDDASLGTITGDAVFPGSNPFATPSQACVTNNHVGSTYYWTQNILPTIAWLKQSCPTCYTYPYDDKSSTFQCNNQAGKSGGFNSVPYLVQFNGTIPGN